MIIRRSALIDPILILASTLALAAPCDAQADDRKDPADAAGGFDVAAVIQRGCDILLEMQESALETDRDVQNGILLPLDHDRAGLGNGYTGWQQLPDDDFLVVNYIYDDAPNAHIRCYRFSESEF